MTRRETKHKVRVRYRISRRTERATKAWMEGYMPKNMDILGGMEKENE